MYPGEAPGYLTLVFESAMDEFIGKDEAFVEQWLVRQGLKKLELYFVHHKTITDVNTTISHSKLASRAFFKFMKVELKY